MPKSYKSSTTQWPPRQIQFDAGAAVFTHLYNSVVKSRYPVCAIIQAGSKADASKVLREHGTQFGVSIPMHQHVNACLLDVYKELVYMEVRSTLIPSGRPHCTLGVYVCWVNLYVGCWVPPAAMLVPLLYLERVNLHAWHIYNPQPKNLFYCVSMPTEP
jgi:hypothetical protein